MVLLSQLIETLGGECPIAQDHEVSDVHIDSRRVGVGDLFAALPGTQTDGAVFAQKALEQGAVAVLSPVRLADLERALNWIHPDARRVTGQAAALVYGFPSRVQKVIGITGTNGKSTVAHLAGELLRSVDRRPAVIGTVEFRLWSQDGTPASHTTPDAAELQRLCKANSELGGDVLVLEVSSHALDQERLSGLELDVAVFTNLSRDHLDYHHDFEAYATAKEKIFECLEPGGAAAINADDPACERMLSAARARGARVVTYGTGSRVDLFASIADAGTQGTHLFLEGMGILRTGLFLPLVGRHNVENALAALAAVLLLGASPSAALAGLASVSSPRGRLEKLDVGKRGFQVFVDYAHTPDALEHALTTLREIMTHGEDAETHALFDGRLLCVFGCGGNRDREKRQPMGEIVGRLADLAIVTNDNPRHEDPQDIARTVLAGLKQTPADVVVELDRRAAIRMALRRAEPGDVVLIAGKGHETWQLQRGKRIPFEDQRVVREELP